MKLFNLEKFINEKVTKRTESMFLNDINFYESSLKEKTEDKSVLVIGGAGSIGSSFIRALLKYAPKAVEFVNSEQEGLATAINLDEGIITKNIIRDGDYQEITDTVDHETGDDGHIQEAPAYQAPNESSSTQMAGPVSASTQRKSITQPKPPPARKEAGISAETEAQLNAVWDAKQQATFDDMNFPM